MQRGITAIVAATLVLAALGFAWRMRAVPSPLTRAAGAPAVAGAPAAVVNIKDFGAQGDGLERSAAVNSRAFQQAFQSLSKSGGGTVRIPAGVFVVDATITIRDIDRIHIQGDGSDSSSIRLGRVAAAGHHSVIRIHASTADRRDLSVTDLTVDSGWSEHRDRAEGAAGIELISDNGFRPIGVRIARCRIRNLAGDGITLRSPGRTSPGPHQIEITENVIEDFGHHERNRMGIAIIGGSDITITRNVIDATRAGRASAPIDFEPNPGEGQTIRGIRIQDNVLIGPPGGVAISVITMPGGSIVEQVTIQHNAIVVPTQGAGIRFIAREGKLDSLIVERNAVAADRPIDYEVRDGGRVAPISPFAAVRKRD
jgi:hypothetical protein